MKYLRFIHWSFFLVSCFACNNESAQQEKHENDTLPSAVHSNDSVGQLSPDTVSTTTSPAQDSILTLTAQGATADLAFNITKDYQQVHIEIPVTDAPKKLKAELKPEGPERNLRISQIVMPDGKTDGPFGLTIEYATPKKGQYTLIIGRNNMAEGTIKGPAHLLLHLD